MTKFRDKCSFASLTMSALAFSSFMTFAQAGGLGSTVGGGVSNTANGDYSTVAGGLENQANGISSTVAGGDLNVAVGADSVVPGGSSNYAGGNFSFAGGFNAHVRDAAEAGDSNGDAFTFFWSDGALLAPQFTSTGDNQFIIKANGGFSLNAPPINKDVSMTIAGTVDNQMYAGIMLHGATANDGILISSGDATPGVNNASFYIDQYNGSDQMRRLSLDKFGRLTITNQAYKPGGGSWAASSDGRLKTNVQPLANALDHLLALKGVTFEYSHPDNGMHPTGTFSGFIAQDVEKVFPNWIGHDNDGYLTVGPQGFEALTVEALRELKSTEAEHVAALEHDNAELRELVANQTRALADLRREVASINSGTEQKSRQLAAATAP